MNLFHHHHHHHHLHHHHHHRMIGSVACLTSVLRSYREYTPMFSKLLHLGLCTDVFWKQPARTVTTPLDNIYIPWTFVFSDKGERLTRVPLSGDWNKGKARTRCPSYAVLLVKIITCLFSTRAVLVRFSLRGQSFDWRLATIAGMEVAKLVPWNSLLN